MSSAAPAVCQQSVDVTQFAPAFLGELAYRSNLLVAAVNNLPIAYLSAVIGLCNFFTFTVYGLGAIRPKVQPQIL